MAGFPAEAGAVAGTAAKGPSPSPAEAGVHRPRLQPPPPPGRVGDGGGRKDGPEGRRDGREQRRRQCEERARCVRQHRSRAEVQEVVVGVAAGTTKRARVATSQVEHWWARGEQHGEGGHVGGPARREGVLCSPAALEEAAGDDVGLGAERPELRPLPGRAWLSLREATEVLRQVEEEAAEGATAAPLPR